MNQLLDDPPNFIDSPWATPKEDLDTIIGLEYEYKIINTFPEPQKGVISITYEQQRINQLDRLVRNCTFPGAVLTTQFAFCGVVGQNSINFTTCFVVPALTLASAVIFDLFTPLLNRYLKLDDDLLQKYMEDLP